MKKIMENVSSSRVSRERGLMCKLIHSSAIGSHGNKV